MRRENDENVVEFRFDGPALDVKPRDFRGCRHFRVLIDTQLRVVECASCNGILDAIEVLIGFANGERILHNTECKKKNLEKQISSLKKEEKRIKARIMTASRKPLKPKPGTKAGDE